MATYTETNLTFDGPEGFPLAAILCEPSAQRNSNSSNPPFQPSHCAILCHGFGSHKNGFHFPAIARHLAAQLGLSSLRFDYTGNMDSPGPFRFGGMMKEVQQMAAAKRYLEQQHRKHVVLLLGHSRGAINATLYSGQESIPLPLETAQQQPNHTCHQQLQPSQPTTQHQPSDRNHAQAAADACSVRPPDMTTSSNGTGSAGTCSSSKSHLIPLVVLVAGRFDLTINMTQRYGADLLQQLQETGPWQQRSKRDGDGHMIEWELQAEEMQERFALDVAGACRAISNLNDAQRPKVLVVHGADDPICEASDAANLAQHIAGSQLMEMPGADHWHKGCEQQLLGAITEFVMRAGRDKGLCK